MNNPIVKGPNVFLTLKTLIFIGPGNLRLADLLAKTKSENCVI